MANLYQNLIVIGFCLILVTGGGVYVTFVDQPEERARLDKAEQVAKSKQVELTTLIAEASSTQNQAAHVERRWKSRYKEIPRVLVSESVIAFLNETTKAGFQPFDISFADHVQGKSFSKYVFNISGRGTMGALYNLVWSVENNRQFYRISDLELDHFDLITTDQKTSREQLRVMVSFKFQLEAYYGGAEGLSASDVLAAESDGNSLNVPLPMRDISQVPPGILPPRRLAENPFLPLIMNNIPPNSRGLMEVDEAHLVSIVGSQAVFEIKGPEFVTLELGDEVYLGHITEIDPRLGLVRARLNKGGIVDDVEFTLDINDRYRQAAGASRLSPSNPY
jgi:hypothetical protein